MDPTKLLLDSAQRLFAEGCEQEAQEQLEKGNWPRELWRQVEENGLPQALVPEDQGGIGLPLESVAAILRTAGAFALPLPLAETMIGSALLAEAELPIPPGPLALVIGTELTVDRNRDGASISGQVPRVPWLPTAEHLVVVGDASLTLIAAASLPEGSIATRSNGAGEPQGRLELRSFQAPLQHHRSAPQGSLNRAHSLGAISRIAMTAGALDRVLDLCIEHANGRVQFGKPIARFQAVQQIIAVLAGEVACVGVSAGAAARAWDLYRDEFAVAAARTTASLAAGKVARLAHQVHAAIGFTREHALHRFTRRLWAWRDDYLSEQAWSLVAGEIVVRAGGDGLWSRFTQHS